MNDIYSQIDKAIEDFNRDIDVVPVRATESNARHLSEGAGGYKYNQSALLYSCEMAYNSKFESGNIDPEGKRKLYFNITRFYVQVANKNTDVDTKNFVFRPVDNSLENIWSVWFYHRQFINFNKRAGFSKIINDLRNDFNKYGTCVAKRVKGGIERIPLRVFINDQSASSLREGVEGGTPLIQVHDLSYYQMSKYGWDMPDRFEGKQKVLEIYKYCTQQEYKELMNGKYDKEYDVADKSKDILVMCIVMPNSDKAKKSKVNDGKILFCSQADDIPYEEAHSDKIDGRWVAIGNIEKQLENQIARNSTINLRQRSMMWASKNVFQTQGEQVVSNLIQNVDDGEVLQVGINGLMQRVDTSSHSLSDYAQEDQVWDDNSKQQSFAFESATGESFASGTPFRLGAMLSNSVMGYFDLQKEIFGLFLKDLFYNQIIPIFEKSLKDDLILIGKSEAGYNNLLELMAEQQAKDYYYKLMLSPEVLTMDNIPSFDSVKANLGSQLEKSPYIAIKILKDNYKTAKFEMDLDITGESEEPADKETLVNLYTTMSQKGDPRADKVLEAILAMSGKNLTAIAGKIGSQAMSPVQTTGASNPNLQGLISTQSNAK